MTDPDHSNVARATGARSVTLGKVTRVVNIADSMIGWILDRFILVVAGVLLALMNYSVFARFALNRSVSWGEELPAYILACLTFIGAAQLTRTNEHLGFDLFLRRFSSTVQSVVIAGNLILMAAFGSLLAYYGTIMALSFGARQIVSLDIPVVVFRTSMPLGGALIALFCTFRLLGLVIGVLRPHDFFPQSDD